MTSRSSSTTGSETCRGLLRSVGYSPRPYRAQGSSQEAQCQDEEGSDGNQTLKKKFLRRLGIALVTYGSSSPRVEYLIAQAAERLYEKVSIGVFNSALLLIFSGTGDPSRDETYFERVEVDTDVAKLQATDELANSVGVLGTPLSSTYRQLSTIATRESPFGSWSMLLGYTFTAPTAALLFFNGRVWDAVFSLVLGLGVGLLSLSSSKIPALRSAQEFLSAVFVSFVARIISVYFKHLDVCYFPMAISGLTWLLPGEGLTIGISEVVENSLVSGTSRIVKALVSSLQLGFGLVVGEKMLWWNSDSVQKECTPSKLSQWWDVLWLLGFSLSVNVLFRARPWPWPGMTLVAGAGVLVDRLTGSFGSEISAVVSSFAIGVTGIQVILPGGIGVHGVQAIMKHDVLSGLGFVMSMINVCVSITLGLLISKVVIVDAGVAIACAFTHSRHTLASSFREERWKESKASEEEENERVAI